MSRTGNPIPAESVPDFTALIAELRNEFLHEARAQCRSLAAALQGPLSEPDRTRARLVLHRWAGLGGTLGYPLVTRLAREIEQLLAASDLAALSARLDVLAGVFEDPPPAADLE